MRILKLLLLWYFVIAGLALHAACGAVWVLKPDLVRTAWERAGAFLTGTGHLPLLAAVDPGRERLSDDQVFSRIPAWRPRTAGPDAPPPGSARIGTRLFASAPAAADALTPGATLDLGEGVYKSPLVIRVSNVRIRGHGHVVFEKGTARGKGSLVVAADNVRISDIECREIAVPDGNGACIRFEGRNLAVERVYFHDAQQGILTGSNPGLVDIRASRFERLGQRGQAHGIYIGGGRLAIADSLFLAARGEGHEIKSRAAETTIVRSVVASLNGVDSRLIDAPNGGVLRITDSLLCEGPDTANTDVIGFGLETGLGHHPADRVVLRNNLIVLDREGSVRLLHLVDERMPVEVAGNRIVARNATPYDKTNVLFRNRKAAGLAPYPALPWEQLPLGGTGRDEP